MANIIQISDFKGAYKLGVGTDTNAQAVPLAVIEEWEPVYIARIFGFDIKNQFYASEYGGGVIVPTPELVKLYDKIEQDDPYVKTDGLKVTLCKLLYLHIVQAQITFNSTGGNRKVEVQVSQPSSNSEVAIIYNHGIDSAWNMQHYCRLNPTLYTTFRPKCLKHTSFI